jgi:hypothetical protein
MFLVFLGIAALLLETGQPYLLVFRDGKTMPLKQPPTLQGDQLRGITGDGISFTLLASLIDLEASETASRTLREKATTEAGSQGAVAAPSEGQSPKPRVSIQTRDIKKPKKKGLTTQVPPSPAPATATNVAEGLTTHEVFQPTTGVAAYVAEVQTERQLTGYHISGTLVVYQVQGLKRLTLTSRFSFNDAPKSLERTFAVTEDLAFGTRLPFSFTLDHAGKLTDVTYGIDAELP